MAFFNRSYFPDTSATGQLLTELCESLANDHGCRVSVVAGASLLPVSVTDGAENRDSGLSTVRGGMVVSRETRRGVEILRARGTRFSKRLFIGRFGNYLTYFLSACWAGLRLDRPDVVVALTDPPIIGLAGMLAARRFGAPFAMAYKDVFPEVARLLEDFHSPSVEAVLLAVNRFLACHADRVACLGETMRQKLVREKGADPTRSVVIPDWTDCRAIRPASKDNPFSRRHGLTDKFVVMHSGNIGLAQQLENLIEAAVHLRARSDVVVVLVGEGVRKDSLRRRAEELGLDNVRFLPFQPKERLIESFAAADVFLVSLKEGLAGYIVPSKLYGILAAGRPFVASVEEESEVVAITRRFNCGLVAKHGDPKDLARQILRLRDEPGLASALGANARDAALHFDRPRQVEAYLSLFREMLDERTARIPTPWAKRFLDVLLSGLGLALSSPLWVLIGLAVKLEDGGPVFYGQARVGRAGRRFRSWKFRSMVVDSDARFGPVQARFSDSRVTRVGRLLRATAMDELPQLWNILKGEMSFVGPRALMPAEVEVRGDGRPVAMEEIPGYFERHRVTPGLTGIAQIFAPRDLPRRSKFRLDRLYVSRRSFWLDLKLILLSFWITFRGKWEERGEKL